MAATLEPSSPVIAVPSCSPALGCVCPDDKLHLVRDSWPPTSPQVRGWLEGALRIHVHLAPYQCLLARHGRESLLHQRPRCHPPRSLHLHQGSQCRDPRFRRPLEPALTHLSGSRHPGKSAQNANQKQINNVRQRRRRSSSTMRPWSNDREGGPSEPDDYLEIESLRSFCLSLLLP